MEQIEIKILESQDWDYATALIWRVFLRCNAADYEQEGIESFLNFISDEHLRMFCSIGEFEGYGAYLGGRLVGVCMMRQTGHLSLLFIDTDYHKKGIGSKLLRHVSDIARSRGRVRLTVNATPYGTGFYHRTGFKDTGPEQIKEGVRYIPMELRFEQTDPGISSQTR